jgi:hypothetical protein
VSASSPNPPAEDDEWANFDLRRFVLDTVKSIEWHGHRVSVLEDQVLRIEECIIAPWWRRWLLLRRLRREIRASVATFDDDYIARDNFIWRRSEYTFQQATAIVDMERGSSLRWVREDRDRRRQPEQPGGDDGHQQDDADPGAGFLS